MDKNPVKSKEIKLLHLGGSQKEALEVIIKKFLENKKVNAKDAVEAFVNYVLKLVEASSAGEKHLCDDDGNLAQESHSQIKKLADGIYLCSGYNINYYKILTTPEIKNLFAKASAPRSRSTIQYANELSYKIKIMICQMLESNNTDINSYIADTEDNYIRNLTSINPMILKNAFIEYFVDVISGNDNHKLSHIQNLMSKYSKYLGFQVLSDRVIEELIQKYSNVEQSRDIGALHAARISIFKLLEKSEVNG